jgi:riboflavin kinase
MSIAVTGKIVSGIGVGRSFITMDWVRKQILEKLGFDPFLGTLNVKMDEEASRRYHSFVEGGRGIPIEPLDEHFHWGKCYRCRINGRIDGAVVVPIVPGYPPDLVEIMAPVNLRENLGLEDGSKVIVEIWAQEGSKIRRRSLSRSP